MNSLEVPSRQYQISEEFLNPHYISFSLILLKKKLYFLLFFLLTNNFLFAESPAPMGGRIHELLFETMEDPFKYVIT